MYISTTDNVSEHFKLCTWGFQENIHSQVLGIVKSFPLSCTGYAYNFPWFLDPGSQDGGYFRRWRGKILKFNIALVYQKVNGIVYVFYTIFFLDISLPFLTKQQFVRPAHKWIHFRTDLRSSQMNTLSYRPA